MKDENKSKKRLIIICVVLAVLILTALAIGVIVSRRQIEKENEAKNAELLEEKRQQEEANNAMDEIKRELTSLFKEYNENPEYLSVWTKNDIINNLIYTENMEEDVVVKEIIVNEEAITDETEVLFDKEIKISITLKKDYSYKIKDEEKTNIVESQKEYVINYKDTIFPVIRGVKNKTITVGGKLDILSGITAKDEKEGNIEVQYEGTVDTKKAGTYKVTIYAVDKNGNRSEKEMTITVKAKATTKPSTGGTSSNGCSSKAVLTKRGYKSADKDACEKDKQSVAVAQQIANEILAKGYTTDLEKVQAAATAVANNYDPNTHTEEGYDYRTPYGVFIKHEASCAGCTRALILVLELMGYKNLVHANENDWKHQWVILTMDGQIGYADGQVGFVGYGEHEATHWYDEE